MTQKDITQKIYATTVASIVLILPAIALAHGGVDDGHEVMEADGHLAGESALLMPGDARWWVVLGTAALLTSGLSWLVWRYLQVPQVKKTETSAPDKK